MGQELGTVEAAITAPLGTRLGGFLLQRRLGAGGMAEVFLAVRAGPEGTEYAAVKRLLPHLTFDVEFVRMFLAEVTLTSALQHPAIARVLECGTAEGGHFLAMEYVHGHDVRELLGAVSDQGCPLHVSVGIVAELADALQYAHEFRSPDGKVTGLIHRDVSPSNVRIEHTGAIKLLDFGIARATGLTQVTRAGQLKGKVGYMSPEQCRAESVDRRTDIFALGVLLYELTLGRRAFYGNSDLEVLGKVVQGMYDPPRSVRDDIPSALESLMVRMLSPSADARPSTAAEVAATLRVFASQHSLDLSLEARATFLSALLEARPYPELPPASPTLHSSTSVAISPTTRARPRRGRWVAGTVAAVAVLAMVAGAGFLAGRQTSIEQGPPPSRDASVDAAPASAPEPSPASIARAEPVKEAALEATPEPAAEPVPNPESDLVESVAESPPAPIATPRGRRPKHRRRQAPAPNPARTEPGMDPNALLAPSLRE